MLVPFEGRRETNLLNNNSLKYLLDSNKGEKKPYKFYIYKIKYKIYLQV